MAQIRLDEDIKPLSEFRANVSSYIQQVRETKRPLVLTQHGHSSAVVLDVSEYERLREELETLRDIHLASEQLDRGEGVSREDVKAGILSELA